MRRILQQAIALAVVVVLASATAGWATQGWRSQSKPLRVFDGGVAKGAGYGSFSAAPASGRVKVSNAGKLRDLKPTGNSIYHDTRYSFFTCGSGCNAATGSTFQSTRWNGNYWRKFTPSKTHNLSSAYDFARGAIKVCEDQKFSPDPCSGQVVTGFDHF